MTPNHRKLLQLCIETATKRGVERAYKHTETPSRQDIAHSVEQCLWEEIDEFFDWRQVAA